MLQRSNSCSAPRPKSRVRFKKRRRIELISKLEPATLRISVRVSVKPGRTAPVPAGAAAVPPAIVCAENARVV